MKICFVSTVPGTIESFVLNFAKYLHDNADCDIWFVTSFDEEFSKKLPQDIQKRALQKLRMLHVASVLDDLKIPPSNHLESLSGDRQGQHSIRINDQYRVCFRWLDNHSFDVEIVDYHS